MVGQICASTQSQENLIHIKITTDRNWSTAVFALLLKQIPIYSKLVIMNEHSLSRRDPTPDFKMLLK